MTDSDNVPRLHPFLRDLVTRASEPRHFQAVYRFAKSEAADRIPLSITDFLGLDKRDLSAGAVNALEAIEGPGGDHHAAWLDFKWKLTAFEAVQDIFDTVIADGDSAMIPLQQYYFYYESSRLLGESILCGLNGFYAAANVLMRPFVEFSILQNYFYRHRSDESTYRAIETYFTTGIAPKASTMLKKALPKDDFCRPIRFRLQTHLSSLSDTSQHVYHPEYSASQHQSQVGVHSLEGLHFWYHTRVVLESTLWLYYVNFPLLFAPVDVVRKFGFNSPVGVFVDEQVGHAIERSLGSESYKQFLEYARDQQLTQDRLAWCEAQPDLTDDAIIASWDTA